MIFEELGLAGAYVIDLEKKEDERGFFARAWCDEEFRTRGIDPTMVQCNLSYNRHKGTLRGMHYQVAPHEEPKWVRCIRGEIEDVLLDLRPESATFKRWAKVRLSADNRRMVYIPPGFAHGFQSLTDDSEVFYFMGATYHPEASRGARWDDPAFGIEWEPFEERIISDRDRSYPDFEEVPAHS